MTRILPLLLIGLLLLFWARGAQAGGSSLADPALLASAYGGDEYLRYDISWTGGVKIGELELTLTKIQDGKDRFQILAEVRDWGMFRFFYPVHDRFVTEVRGPFRLPVEYQVLQVEGEGKTTRRMSWYDQAKRVVRYKKNEEGIKEFKVTGDVHNEFSSFFLSRALPLEPGEQAMVPTFADEKRHEVKVEVRGRRRMEETILGAVNTIEVLPHMTFKGLYDKVGDTVIWFSDDSCRVPVLLNSKILIGSLTATLVRYQKKGCGDFPKPQVEHKGRAKGQAAGAVPLVQGAGD